MYHFIASTGKPPPCTRVNAIPLLRPEELVPAINSHLGTLTDQDISYLTGILHRYCPAYMALHRSPPAAGRP